MKKFFIFKVNNTEAKVDDTTAITCIEVVDGTIGEARESLKSIAYEAGTYLILEDTSGAVTKTITTTQKVDVDFEPTRKRPRKEKADRPAKAPKDKAAK